MYKLVFLIPYYNHPKKILDLVKILSSYKIDILIIDDGSDSESKNILYNLKNWHNSKTNNEILEITTNENIIRIYSRERNGGKGAAIKSGISIAKTIGYTHAFQLDADMQHDLTKIEEFIAKSKDFRESLICGNPIYGEDVPKSRLHGRKITNFWIYINTFGSDIKDSMCGMRIYPLDSIANIISKCASNRMDFDIEILVLAYKYNIKMFWIDILVSYDSNGVSHFKLFKDNVLISKVHAKHFFLLPFFIIKKLFRL